MKKKNIYINIYKYIYKQFNDFINSCYLSRNCSFMVWIFFKFSGGERKKRERRRGREKEEGEEKRERERRGREEGLRRKKRNFK